MSGKRREPVLIEEKMDVNSWFNRREHDTIGGKIPTDPGPRGRLEMLIFHRRETNIAKWIAPKSTA